MLAFVDMPQYLRRSLFDYPVKIIAGKNTSIPYSKNLEDEAIPGVRSIEEELRRFINK